MRRTLMLVKATGYAIFLNSIQIVMATLIGLIAVFGGGDVLSGALEQAAIIVMAAIIVWGAVVDIRDAFTARKIADESDMLEDAYAQLESLNSTLRAQRHDFMNHLQVVFALIEMGDEASAKEYIGKVYGDIQLVGRSLKTALPAINALLAAKTSAMDEAKIKCELVITAQWQELPMPGWEMCRVLGNIIDNAVDACSDAAEPSVKIALSEDISNCLFKIENNGGEVAENLREKIFQAGFSTKSAGRGMGLSIVRELVERYGGEIRLECEGGRTIFAGRIPKKTPEVK